MYVLQHLLTLDYLTPSDLDHLLAHTRQIKQARAASLATPQLLAGQTVALLFEKPSLRTRVSFEVAAHELGAHTLYLSPAEVGLGARESVADVARVLSGFVHYLVVRTYNHAIVEELAAHASIPVINALTDAHHPCQGLTDVYTIGEQFGKTAGLTIAYVGDGNNVAHSLIQAAVKAGMHMRVATPRGYEPHPQVMSAAQREARLTGGSLTLLTDPAIAATGAHALYTDVWTSMGQEDEAVRRRAVFAPYQVNDALLALAAPDAIVLHPLPAHRGDEITDAVLDGPRSRVFVQAENRLHVQKSLLYLLATSGRQASLSA